MIVKITDEPMKFGLSALVPRSIPAIRKRDHIPPTLTEAQKTKSLPPVNNYALNTFVEDRNEQRKKST